MPPPILLGESDFSLLRSQGGLYVDKSHFITSVIEGGAKIQLHPRPRRFGKTLNMSALRYFFEIGEDQSALFSDLQVWKSEAARKHFQRYPVIYLSFKNIKHETWAEALEAIRALLAKELERHSEVLGDTSLPETHRERLRSIQRLAGIPTMMLDDLSSALFKHYKQPAVILIDEYDAPLLNAWEKGFYEEALSWFRAFFTDGLKDGEHLYKGVLTGVMRISQESLFSGLNNISVHTLLQREMPEPFGFTEGEVEALLRQFEREGELGEFRSWYNGYRFGEETVYNPWSISHALYKPLQPLQPWWVNTSENSLIKSLLLGRPEFHRDFLRLLSGERVEQELHEHTTPINCPDFVWAVDRCLFLPVEEGFALPYAGRDARPTPPRRSNSADAPPALGVPEAPLRQLKRRDVWGLLLFSGYLRADSVRYEVGRRFATLSMPNLEVSTVWTSTFLEWLEETAGDLEPLHSALLSGDADQIQTLLSGMLLRHVSVHDVTLTQDEVFYHAFVLGLLVSLEKTHRVKSNREEGLGRADVLILPRKPGEPGAVLEFKKKSKGKTLQTSAKEALAQIQDRKYTAALEEVGASPIVRVGISFSGKAVEVCSALNL